MQKLVDVFSYDYIRRCNIILIIFPFYAVESLFVWVKLLTQFHNFDEWFPNFRATSTWVIYSDELMHLWDCGNYSNVWFNFTQPILQIKVAFLFEKNCQMRDFVMLLFLQYAFFTQLSSGIHIPLSFFHSLFLTFLKTRAAKKWDS